MQFNSWDIKNRYKKRPDPNEDEIVFGVAVSGALKNVLETTRELLLLQLDMQEV